MVIRRGEIWWAELPDPRRSEPGFRRPVLVVQADAFNKSRIKTVVVAAITSNLALAEAPGNVLVPKNTAKLGKDSVVNVSQTLTIDHDFLVRRVCQLGRKSMRQVEEGLKLALDLKSLPEAS